MVAVAKSLLSCTNLGRRQNRNVSGPEGGSRIPEDARQFNGHRLHAGQAGGFAQAGWSASGAYAPTKAYLNAVTIQYAKELSDTNVLINNACPGYVATDLNAFNGTHTPEQGAAIAIRLATLPDDGPTGG